MKKVRSLWVVGIVAALLLVLVFVPRLFPPKDADTAREGVPEASAGESAGTGTRVKLVDLDLSTIRSVAISYPEGSGFASYTLIPLEESDLLGFRVAGRPEITLMDGVAETIMFSAAILSADEEGTFTDVPEEDLAGFGFDENSPVCTITTEDGSVAVTRGGFNPDGTGRYVMRTDDPAVYLVEGFTVDGIFPTLYDIRNKMLSPIDPQQFAGMRLSRGDEIIYDIRLYASDDPFDAKLFSFFAVEPFSPPRGIDEYRLDEVLKPMADGVVVERFIDDPEDLEVYGLDKDHGRRITIYGTEQITLDLMIGADAEQGSVYTIFPGASAPVMVMPKAALAIADTDALYLVEKFASIVGIDAIDEFRITIGDESWRGGISREEQAGQEDPAESFWFLDRPAPEDQFKDLYQVIIGLQIEGIADPEQVMDASAESLMQITYVLRDHPDVVKTIDLYPYDKDFAVLSVDGGTRFFLMGLYQIDHVAQQARQLEAVVQE